MIIEAIRDFLKGCPSLSHDRIHADFLGDKAIGYSIDPIAAPLILKRYAGGDTMRQFAFAFRSRELSDGIKNNGFYQQLAAWLEGESEAGSLPELGANQVALKIEAVQGGELVRLEADSAVYQIKCRLIYYQRGA